MGKKGRGAGRRGRKRKRRGRGEEEEELEESAMDESSLEVPSQSTLADRTRLVSSLAAVSSYFSLTLGACAARVTVVAVCLFVSNCSRTTGYEAAYERYQQIQCYKGRKNNVAILLKRLRSRDMA